METVDYGSRLRAGILIPSGNSVAEPEIRAMLPAGVSPLVTRLALRGSSERELLGMLDQLESASALLSDAEVAVIAFHCTAVSTFAPHLSKEICQRIRGASKVDCFTTADAILKAMKQLGAKRVTLLTPYVNDVHRREISFLESNGISVVSDAHLCMNTNSEMATLTPVAIAGWAADKIDPSADACFISCTAIRSAPAISLIERATGMPVLTSNQCMVWHLLRSHSIVGGPTRFGRLFSTGIRLAC